MSNDSNYHEEGEASLHSNFLSFLGRNEEPFYQRDGTTVVTFRYLLNHLLAMLWAVFALLRHLLYAVLYVVHVVRVLLPFDVIVTALLVAWRRLGLRSAHVTERRQAAVFLLWYPYFTVGTVLKIWYCLRCLLPAWWVLLGYSVALDCSAADFFYAALSLGTWFLLHRSLPALAYRRMRGLSPRAPEPRKTQLDWDGVEDFGGWEKPFGPGKGSQKRKDKGSGGTAAAGDAREDGGSEEDQEAELSEGHIDFEEEVAGALRNVVRKRCRKCEGRDHKCTDSAPTRLKLKKSSNTFKNVYYAIFSRAPKGKRRYVTSK